MSSTVIPIRVEQLNLNDEHVKLVKWFVKKGDHVDLDQLICSVETTKTVNEIYASQAGIIYPTVTQEGAMVKVGDTIGLIADSMADIEAYLSEQYIKNSVISDKKSSIDAAIKATPKAQALAQEHGIDLKDVARMGVLGTIKEADVEKFLCIPSTLRPFVIDEGRMPDYEHFVTRKLKSTRETTLPLTMDAVLDLTAVNKYIDRIKQQGITISLLHIILAALPKTLARHDRFKMFQVNDRIFTYRQVNIAFIVRTIDGKLYMPVILDLDKMVIDQIAEASQELALDANRGRLKPSQLMGACFCVSYIGNKSISRFEAFTDSYQSAMLAVAGSQPTTTLTLTYDHSLIDGWMASAFLSDLILEIERVVK